MQQRIRINDRIQASELRVVGSDGENLGVISLSEALAKAREAGLDLIEISPTAIPPIAKIMDYGKYLYSENKKKKESKAKTSNVETKAIQITIGTGDHDLDLKAKKAGEWLREGHRIKVDLFLRGRAKYLDKKFLKDRLEKILKLIPENFKVVEEARQSPKGLSMAIERAGK